MGVAFLHFPTALLGEYGDQRLAVVIYAGCLAITRLMLTAVWWYATRDQRLVDENLDSNVIRLHRMRGLGLPLVFLLSIGPSFISVQATIYS
jgi:hypothetical protein